MKNNPDVSRVNKTLNEDDVNLPDMKKWENLLKETAHKGIDKLPGSEPIQSVPGFTETKNDLPDLPSVPKSEKNMEPVVSSSEKKTDSAVENQEPDNGFGDSFGVVAKNVLKFMGLTITCALGMKKSFDSIMNTLDKDNPNDIGLLESAISFKVLAAFNGRGVGKGLDEIKYTEDIAAIVYNQIIRPDNLEDSKKGYGKHMNYVIKSFEDGLNKYGTRDSFEKHFLEHPLPFMNALLIASGEGSVDRVKHYCELALNNLSEKDKASFIENVRDNFQNIGFHEAKYFLSKGDLFFPEDTVFKKNWAGDKAALNCSWAGKAFSVGNPAFALAWEESGRHINLHDIAVSNKIKFDAVEAFPRGTDGNQVGNNVTAYATGNRMMSSIPRSIKYGERDILEMYSEHFVKGEFKSLHGAELTGVNHVTLAHTIYQSRVFNNRMGLKLNSDERIELQEIQSLQDKFDIHRNKFNIEKVQDLPLTIELNKEVLRQVKERRVQENQEHFSKIRMEIS